MWKWHPNLLVLGPGFITRLGGSCSGSGSTTGTGSGVVLGGLPIPVHEEGVYTVQSQGGHSENRSSNNSTVIVLGSPSQTDDDCDKDENTVHSIVYKLNEYPGSRELGENIEEMKYEEDERGYQCGDEDKLGPALSQGYPPVDGATDERNQTQHHFSYL